MESSTQTSADEPLRVTPEKVPALWRRAPTLLAREIVLLFAVLPEAVLAYIRDLCFQWAAALAYYTVIGLVPVLTSLFAVIKYLDLHRELTPFIATTIGAGSRDVALPIVHFIDRTNLAAVGVVSVVAVCLASAGILGSVELVFNVIWGRLPGRSVWRKLRAYAAVAVTGPTLLLIALAFTALFRRGSAARQVVENAFLGSYLVVLLRLVPYAVLFTMFTIMYNVLPNARVSRRSAIVGAVVAGTLWQLAQWAYVNFMISLVRFSAIYGALWQLPILLAWIYIGWLIVLAGAEVCAAHQRRRERV